MKPVGMLTIALRWATGISASCSPPAKASRNGPSLIAGEQGLSNLSSTDHNRNQREVGGDCAGEGGSEEVHRVVPLEWFQPYDGRVLVVCDIQARLVGF